MKPDKANLVAACLVLAATSLGAPPSRAGVLAQLRKTADWQIAQLSKPTTGWVDAAFYTGLVALGKLPGCERYLDQVKAYGEAFHWKLGPRRLHADDHCIAQAYFDLYEVTRDKRLIEPSVSQFTEMLRLPFDEPLTWRGGIANREWAWCDALFMAPPALARCAKATGDPRFLHLMDRLYEKTRRYLYNPTQRLFHRDGSYFDKREPNGQQVFWSRGNGWVLAGLARMLQVVPKAHPTRTRYEKLFKEMAERVAELQGSDGFWRASLLDPLSVPNPESSGTAFFCFALAWGVNERLLPKERYRPVAMKAWKALLTAVRPDGRLGWVQPVGSDPRAADENSSAPYGVGAFLLAGTEVYRGLR